MDRLNEIHEYLKKRFKQTDEELKNMDSSSVNLAYEIAEYAHRNQKRDKGEDYVNHPLRCLNQYRKLVGINDDDPFCINVDLMYEYGIPYEGVQEVCLLHDVIEDTDFTLEDIEEIYNNQGFETYFSLYMKDALIKITHKDDVEYKDYFLNLLNNRIASIVKLMDMHDNMDILSLTKFDEKNYERTSKYLIHSYVLNNRYHFIENIEEYKKAFARKDYD